MIFPFSVVVKTDDSGIHNSFIYKYVTMKYFPESAPTASKYQCAVKISKNLTSVLIADNVLSCLAEWSWCFVHLLSNIKKIFLHKRAVCSKWSLEWLCTSREDTWLGYCPGMRFWNTSVMDTKIDALNGTTRCSNWTVEVVDSDLI